MIFRNNRPLRRYIADLCVAGLLALAAGSIIGLIGSGFAVVPMLAIGAVTVWAVLYTRSAKVYFAVILVFGLAWFNAVTPDLSHATRIEADGQLYKGQLYVREGRVMYQVWACSRIVEKYCTLAHEEASTQDMGSFPPVWYGMYSLTQFWRYDSAQHAIVYTESPLGVTQIYFSYSLP